MTFSSPGVLVEDGPRRSEVEQSVVSLLHGSAMSQSRYAAPPCTRRRGRHLGQPVELPQRFLLRLLGHLRRLDLLAERIDFLRPVVALAELLLDRLELLAQVVLALPLAHLGLHLRLDLRAQLEDLHLLGERGDQPLQTRLDVGGFEQLLLHRGAERGQRRADHVGEPARLRHILNRPRELVGQQRRQLDDLAKQRRGVADERLGLEIAGRCDLVYLFDPREEIRPRLGQLEDAEPPQPLHDEAKRAVGLLHDLVNRGHRADAMQIRLARLLRRGIALGDHADRPVASRGLLDELERRGPPGREGQNGLREQHRVAQRQHGPAQREPSCLRAIGSVTDVVINHGLRSFPGQRGSEQVERRELARGRPDERLAAVWRRIFAPRGHVAPHVVHQALDLRLHVEHSTSHL